jgi:hypothetical protein
LKGRANSSRRYASLSAEHVQHFCSNHYFTFPALTAILPSQ